MVVACVSGKPTTIGTIHSLGGANQDNSIVCFIFLIAFDLYISGSFSWAAWFLNDYIFDRKSFKLAQYVFTQPNAYTYSLFWTIKTYSTYLEYNILWVAFEVVYKSIFVWLLLKNYFMQRILFSLNNSFWNWFFDISYNFKRWVLFCKKKNSIVN